MNNVYIIGDKDYLMHHGIKGQKWGVENGPPYPLNPQKDYSKAEQKANAKALKKAYKKDGAAGGNKVNIKDVDLSSDDKIDRYINNIVGKYGDIEINKFFDLKSSMKYDIKNQLSEAQSKYVQFKCADTLSKNKYKKDKTYDEYEKELPFINDNESYTIHINSGAFDTKDIKGLQDTINKMSNKKSFNEIYNKVKDQVTEIAFTKDYKPLMYMDGEDENWANLPVSQQKKIFKEKLGTWSWNWDDKSSHANNAVDVAGPNYLSFMMESGGFYGDHALSFEYDIDKNKIMYGLGLEG